MNFGVIPFITKKIFPLLSVPTADIEKIGETIPVPKFEEYVVRDLLKVVVNDLRKNKPLIRVQGDVYIIGDLHGNFHDFLRILSRIPDFLSKKFILLGDYVDRGHFQIELVITILTLAIQYPDNFFLLRGNHEFREINLKGGFYDEVCSEYSENLYEYFNEAFDYLSLAAIVNNAYFCVHGGIGPNLKDISKIENIVLPYRNYDNDNFVKDMMWSDPANQSIDFCDNVRGVGSIYGLVAISNFMHHNNLKGIIRGHESIKTGISMNSCKNVCTVFSSSGYGDSFNPAGYIMISEKDNKFHFYYYRPILLPAREKALWIFHRLEENVRRVQSIHEIGSSNNLLKPLPRRRNFMVKELTMRKIRRSITNGNLPPLQVLDKSNKAILPSLKL
ncbi:Serine/threonine-protein phosphatase PP1-2 [Tritrichomonas foetus]|uniref:Serine/threonine-protein phosphatase n=1 Tax=Tritrichomonas foetus TaxID=1144522 RepID=A0A1J4JCX9_9EUKA|nr:Serine/threonine-protein phosphatase PP1-2 [Tritrichomonas foetus]|eukprot:OHS97026.1 Serine/threonine-protein phosphatase PP1-2 [Tritrichomonas foetus]